MTEEHALLLLKNKDPVGLDYFIQKYTPYVSAVILNVIGRHLPKEDAEEVCSDVFIALWMMDGTPQHDRVKAYLGSTARFKAISRLRKCGQDLQLEEDYLTVPTDSPEETLEKEEQAQCVRNAVLALGPPDRDIFIRYYYYCQPTANIARDMNLSPANIRQRLKRGRDRLREELISGGITYGI